MPKPQTPRKEFLGTLYELWTRSTRETTPQQWMRFAVSAELGEIIAQIQSMNLFAPGNESVIVAVHRCTLADNKPLTPPTGRPSENDVDQVH